MTGQQLKNSILQLAIQGRLVAQDPADEPASVLLQRIRQEKQRLVKEGKLKKKDLTSTPITEEDKPFDIPETWEWCRLYDVVSPDCTLSYGIVQPMNDVQGGVPVVRPVDMNVSVVHKLGLKRVDKSISDCYQRTILKGGEILFCVRGTVGKISLASKELVGCNVTRGISPIRFNDEDTKNFIYNVLMSPLSKKEIEAYSKGAALQQINIEDLKKLLIPLPPISEQRRIVARIEELMPLVEAYGKAQEELEALNAGLPEALKKSILQEAIQGRLVPQDPNDEPASVLLARIRKEKEQLVKAGKLKKKDLTTTPITEEEKPFDIPETWEWVKIQHITYQVGTKENQIRSSEVLTEGKIRVVSQGKDLIDGYSNEASKGIYDLPLVMFGDHTRNVKYIDFPFVIGADGTKFHKCILVHAKYIYYWMTLISSKLRDRGYARHYTLLKEELIPLPPLSEQRRIVSKIENLFAAIDQMKDLH